MSEDPEAPVLAWLRARFGRDFYADVVEVNLGFRGATDASLIHLSALTKLESLNLDCSNVTDAGLVHIATLTRLRYLELGACTKVSDKGMAHLKELTGLNQLTLDRTQVRDAGLVHLAALSELQWLGLHGTLVTDAGLVHLNGMSKLENLDVGETSVTQNAAAQFKTARPRCHITMQPWAWSHLDGTPLPASRPGSPRPPAAGGSSATNE